MNGAQALIRTFVGSGVDVCFANPGTSEMHFVAALDDVPEMRAVLGLFEGVVTGAADGYGRMARRPAATLLHLGPGPRQRHRQPPQRPAGPDAVVNVVGDHATTHLRLRPAPGLGHREPGPPRVALVPVVGARRRPWPPTPSTPCRAPSALPAGWPPWWCPADVSWHGGRGARLEPPAARSSPPWTTTSWPHAAKALRSGEPAVAPRGRATRCDERGPRRRQPGGRRPPGPSSCARRSRPASNAGPGCPAVERLGYLAEFTIAQLQGARHLVLADALAPVSFFAYPGIPGYLVPDGCEVHTLATADRRRRRARSRPSPTRWARRADAATLQAPARPDRPTGALNAQTVAAAIGALLPEGAVVSDEGNTSGLFVSGRHRRCARATTGCASPVAPSARACPWPPARRWRARTGGCCASRPTAVPCTPCSRCGPRSARAST